MSTVTQTQAPVETLTKPLWEHPKDQRVFLKIKAATLVAEARIIRKRERSARGELRNQLHEHRVLAVRKASRDTGIALGLIRGKSYKQIENIAKSRPDWVAIARMVKQYGGPNHKELMALIEVLKTQPLAV